MKRCPQCNRVESDEALSFCRIDGTPLVNDSSSFDDEAGTVRLDPTSTEASTNILGQTTNARDPRSTGPTTVLSAQPTAITGSIGDSKLRGKKGLDCGARDRNGRRN
jgi:hypothetical protein